MYRMLVEMKYNFTSGKVTKNCTAYQVWIWKISFTFVIFLRFVVNLKIFSIKWLLT